MESSNSETNPLQSNPPTETEPQAPKHKPIESYVTVFNNEFLETLQNKLDSILKIINIPTSDDKTIFILPTGSAENPSPLNLSTYKSTTMLRSSLEITSLNNNYIIDLQNFYPVKEDGSDTELNLDLFKNLISKTKDKGYNLFLMDFHHLKQLPYALAELHKSYEEKVNFLSRMYIIEKTPITALVSIQKFENNKNDFKKAKILNYEMYEDYTITKPVTINYVDLSNSLSYMYEMYQYQAYLKTLHSGDVLKINIRENFWSDNIDFNFTICDSNDEDLLNKRICKAIIVSKTYSKDFLYLSAEGNQTLCRQVEASRIILIRQNSFNTDSVEVMKDKIHHYILLFKFENCVNAQIPIMLMSESRDDAVEVYSDNKILIKDVVENEKKDTFRQLRFKDNLSEIQTEIKLNLVSKTKIKTNPESYSTLFTEEKFKQKNIIQCLDEEFVSSFYIKCLLSGMFFINTNEFPEKNFEILILGAGCGTINHFFRKIFGEKVTITSVEIDRDYKDIGIKYFGFKNNSKNFTWFFEDALEYVKKDNCENKYDMVIIDINNFNLAQGISPSPSFFEENFLKQINKMLKESGIYIINLMARNFNLYGNALTSLEKAFELIFLVENNEDLNKIHYCFKKKFDNKHYLKNYQVNYDKYSLTSNLNIIQNDYKKILSRIVDINDFKAEINKHK